MIFPGKTKGLIALALILPLLAACRKQEQAVQGTVKGIEQAAVNAEQKAQATASELDSQRDELEKIPLPTKSMFAGVREASQWANPFLSVGPEFATLRIAKADAGQAASPKSQTVRGQQSQVKIEDLAQAITAIPAEAWRYGRVIAVEESPDAAAKARPAVRRNVVAVMRKLNDLGVVVEEWPRR